jgi:PD-(D/E)XK endonuclease
LLKAEMMGFHLALPWGDSERWDFVVWGREAGRAVRVQVKGTGRLDRGGYDVQPVHSTRKGGKKRYTKKDIDVIAAHVQPEDAWYLIPIEAVGRAKSLRLCPQGRSRESQNPHPVANGATRMGQLRRVKNWEWWRDAWELLGER